MSRRNFVVKILLWILSFIFGYRFLNDDGDSDKIGGSTSKRFRILDTRIDQNERQVDTLSVKTSEWISIEGYKTPENSWNDAFTQAFSDALSQKKNIVLPYGEVQVTSSITLTRPIKIRGYGDAESNLNFDKSQTVIRYQGTGAFLKIDVPAKHGNWSGFSFVDFRFISDNVKGGFLAVNKGKVMQHPDISSKNPFSNQPCGHLRRPYFRNLLIQKIYKNSENVTVDSAIGIEAVAMMNGDFENCMFVGWDLALSLSQSDINKFDNCLFVSNVQICKLSFLNTYGSQNKFYNCDFQVRRLGVGDLYQIIDHAKHTKFDNCYFEIGGSPTGTRIKGWFNFDGGANHQVESGRFDDIITARVTEHFAYITKDSFLVTFDRCHASLFNDDGNKLAFVEPRSKTQGYSTQSNRGVIITAGSPQFLSYFDLNNSSIVHYSARWGSTERTKEDNDPKRVSFNVHNIKEEDVSAYTTVKDDHSNGGYVFKLPSQSEIHKNDLSMFFPVNKSIIKTNGMYRIKVRARNNMDKQKAKLRITVYRSKDKNSAITTIGRYHEQRGTSSRYFESELLIKSTSNERTWLSGEFLWLTFTAFNGSGQPDVKGSGVLIDNIEIEEIPEMLHIKGSDGNLYVLSIDTSDSSISVSKKITYNDMNPYDTY